MLRNPKPSRKRLGLFFTETFSTVDQWDISYHQEATNTQDEANDIVDQYLFMSPCCYVEQVQRKRQQYVGSALA